MAVNNSSNQILAIPTEGCPLPGGCELTVTEVLSRYALRFQHGDEPEATFEIGIFTLIIATARGEFPVQTWLDQVHAYLREGVST